MVRCTLVNIAAVPSPREARNPGGFRIRLLYAEAVGKNLNKVRFIIVTRKQLTLTLALIAVAIAAGSFLGSRLFAAEDLKLAPALSFTDDSSSNFPIDGKNLANGAAPGERAKIIFFGTAHCWNTNREAERLVSVYPKYRGKIDFVVVDLNNPSPGQRDLISRYYHGYIPTIAILDTKGHVVYDRAGETASDRGDASKLDALINSAH